MKLNKNWIFAAVLAFGLLAAACGDEDDNGQDTGTQQDTSVADTSDDPEDTGDQDTGAEDTTADDTDMPDEDTAPADTGDQDTGGLHDTGDQDTGDQDTTTPDMGMPDGGQSAVEADIDCSQVTPAETVDVVDFEFQPADVTISPGEVVQWNVQDPNHTITSSENVNDGACNTDGTFDATGIQPGDTFCVRYNQTGTYPYHCTPHCQTQDMKGTVTVE